MAGRYEIGVSFEYSVDEKAQYEAASKAVSDYEAKIRKEKIQQQERIERRQKKKRIRKDKLSNAKYSLGRFFRNARSILFEKTLPIACCMMIEACLLIRDSGVEGLEQVGFGEMAKDIYITSNALGALCLIIIAIITVVRTIKGLGFFFSIIDLFIEALKALGIWIIFLFLLYGVTFFASELSIDELKYKEIGNSQDELLEEAIAQEEVAYSKYQMGDQIEAIFTICVEESYIYVEPTDGGHMYVATKDSQFVTTGMEYLDEEGVLWYEFYLDNKKVLTSWVREHDIVFE